MQQSADGFAVLDDRLQAWKVWHRKATRLPFKRPGCVLGNMVAEADEIKQKTQRVRHAIDTMRSVRRAMQDRADKLRVIAALTGDERDRERAIQIEEGRRRVATQIGGLPWASMIRGSGRAPDSDDPLEEETDRAIRCLPRSGRRIIRVHLLSEQPAQDKCRLIGVSERTYWSRVRAAKSELKRTLNL